MFGSNINNLFWKVNTYGGGQKSMRAFGKLTIILLFLAATISGQSSDTDNRLQNGELQMTFPSIYFKHNSTDYATMPYPVDSCFKFIATKIKELNSYPVWRDMNEKERLTVFRIKKLKADLEKFVPKNKIRFQSMGSAQKISKQTIQKTDAEQAQYLLTLNSVLDMSGALKNKSGTEKKQKRGIPRLVWCGWKYGFHWSSKGKTNKKS